MAHRLWRRSWLPLALLLTGLGCAPAAPGRPTLAPTAEAGASAAAPPFALEAATVRVGVLGILAEAGLYIALERGYFAAEGLALELIPFDSGARGLPALAASQVEVSGGAFSPALWNAFQRGVNVKIVAGTAVAAPGAASGFLMVRRDLADEGQIRDWPDLRERILAIPPGRPGAGDYQVARGLAKGGLTIAEVQLVELPFPDMVAAYANRTIEASYTTEPIATTAMDRGVAVKWRNVADWLPGANVALLTFGPSMLDKPFDVGQRFLAAYLRGARDYTTTFRHGVGRAAVVQILTHYTTVKDPALYDRMAMSGIDPDGRVNLANLADQAAYYAEMGVMPNGVDLRPLIDERFREAAVQRLGPYQDP
ncbi:MAG TPA: ABC transporter substrate-binding protein [Chloroflexota bacterium]|jgi:NitT/TauT family transport system substrate-binding protein|nr:ABC transporter substrate-binding protein [Chloroflexota bacterium]